MQQPSIYMTRGVNDLCASDAVFAGFVFDSIRRFVRRDWGDVDESDRAANDAAYIAGDERILASYIQSGAPCRKVWIIREWDSSSTTVLFPHEY